MAQKNQAQQILDMALELAEQRSWEQLRLYDIAGKLGIGLDVVRRHYPQKDDLVEAWYDRADNAMLKFAGKKELVSLSVGERISAIIMSWLEALAPHRRVSGDMLLYKLEPGHVHLQVQGLLRVSRTVQWFCEAARRDTTHMFRIAEEIGLTSIFLATFAYWLRDESADSEKTRAFLARQLARADRVARNILWVLPGASPKAGRTASNKRA